MVKSYQFIRYTTLIILLIGVPMINSTCKVNQYMNSANSCIDCNDRWPGCGVCTTSECTQCMEGLYHYQELCVEDCSHLGSQIGRQLYGYDFNMQCQECGDACEYCVNNYGCTACSSGALSSMVTLGSGLRQCKPCSVGCKMCDQTTGKCLVCEGMTLKDGVCVKSCSNKNCSLCATNPDICTKFRLGHDSGGLVCPTAGVNCVSCEGSVCTQCGEGYYLDSNKTCQACLDSKCAVCGNDGKCQICQDGHVIVDGSCTRSCTVVNQYKSFLRDGDGALTQSQCRECDSTCLRCLDHKPNSCLICSFERYLKIVDPALNTGTCEIRSSTSQQFDIFVGNRAEDYSRQPSTITGSITAPDIDLYLSINRAHNLAAKSKNSTINIYLFKGSHYLLRIPRLNEPISNTRLNPSTIDYHINIKPLPCSGAWISMTTICNPTNTKPILHSKLGDSFRTIVPQSMSISSVIIDSLDSSVVPYYDDPHKCLQSRTQCCQYDVTKQVFKADPDSAVPGEMCVKRVKLVENCQRRYKSRMFYLQQSDESGLADINQLQISKCEFKNFFFDIDTMVHFGKGGGKLNIEFTKFTYITSCGSVIANTDVPLFNSLLGNQNYTKYLKYFNQFYYPPLTKSIPCTGTCFELTFTNNTFQYFRHGVTLKNLPTMVNEMNGQLYHGYIIMVTSFKGKVKLYDNQISDSYLGFQGCTMFCFFNQSGFIITDNPAIYGSTSKTQTNGAIVVGMNTHGFEMVGNTFRNLTSLQQLVTIEQHPTNFENPIILYNNMFEHVGSYYFDQVILTIARATRGKQAVLNKTHPQGGGFYIGKNRFFKMAGCRYADNMVTYLLFNTQNEPFRTDLVFGGKLQAIMLNISYPPRYYTYQDGKGNTAKFDLNIPTFDGNHFEQVVVGDTKSLIYISGSILIRIYNTTVINSGQNYLKLTETISPIMMTVGNYKYGIRAKCNVTGLVTAGSVIRLPHSNYVEINGLYIDNFMSYKSSYGGKQGMIVQSVKGQGVILMSNLHIKNVKGMLSDYAIHTLKVFDYIPSTYDTESAQYGSIFYFDTDQSVFKYLLMQNCKFESIVVQQFDQQTTAIINTDKTIQGYSQFIKQDIINITLDSVVTYKGSAAIRFGRGAYIKDLKCINYGVGSPVPNAPKPSLSPVVIGLDRSSTLILDGFYATGNQVSGDTSAIKFIATGSANTGSKTNLIFKNSILRANSGTSTVLIDANGMNVVTENNLYESNTGTHTGGVDLRAAKAFKCKGDVYRSNSGELSQGMRVYYPKEAKIVLEDIQFIGQPLGYDLLTHPNLNKTTLFINPSQLAVYQTTDLQGKNLTFKDNNFAQKGAAISLDSSTITLEDSLLQSNSASLGGACALFKGSTLNSQRNKYLGNIARSAGAILISENSEQNSQDDKIEGNKAIELGGLKIETRCKLNFIRGTVTRNIALVRSSVAACNEVLLIKFNGTIFELNEVKGASKGDMLTILFSKLEIHNCTFKDNIAIFRTKVINLIDSHLTITNSTFTDQSQSSSHQLQGAYLNTYTSKIIISNTTFINGSASSGGAIYMLEGEATITNSRFISCKSTSSGGAIGGFSVMKLEISNSLFDQPTSQDRGNAISMANMIDKAIITNTTFLAGTDRVNLLSFEQSSFTIINSTFKPAYPNMPTTNTQSGSAIYTFDADMYLIKDSTFMSLVGGLGGIIYTQTSQEGKKRQLSSLPYLIMNSKFIHNRAISKGGALYVDNPQLILLQDNVFESNQAQYGGAINFACQEGVQDCELRAELNKFIGNRAEKNGGAVQWTQNEPKIQENNIFNHNIAKFYGDNIAGVPSQLTKISESFYNQVLANQTKRNLSEQIVQTTTISHTQPTQKSGGKIDKFYLAIIDKYNKVITSDRTSLVQARLKTFKVEGTSTVLDGDMVFMASFGMFKVSNLGIIAKPGSTQVLELFTKSVKSGSGSQASPFKFTIKVSLCDAGEALMESGECKTCEGPNKYSIIPPRVITECLYCPKKHARCLGGADIYPQPGYWREGSSTDTFYKCLNNEACLGYQSGKTNKPSGNCAEGYSGVLCSICIQGYFLSQGATCLKCPHPSVIIFKTIGLSSLLSLLVVVVTLLVIRAAHQRRSMLPIYIKLLMNHMIMVAFISLLQFKWPKTLKQFFNVCSYFQQMSSAIIEVDCLLTQQPNFRIFYQKYLIAIFLPLLTFGLIVLFWSCFRICKVKHLLPKATGSYLILIFLIYPTLTKIFTSAFSCIEIEGVQRLASDLKISCEATSRIIFMSTAGIIGSIVYLIGIPFFLFRWLKQKRSKFSQKTTKFELSFFYSGYKDKYYYWEVVVLLRKFILVSTIIFVQRDVPVIRSYTMLITTLIMLGIHINIQPYINLSLNRLETVSYVVMLCSYYASIVFINSKQADDPTYDYTYDYELSPVLEMILILMVIIVNVGYLLIWMYTLIQYYRIQAMKLGIVRRVFRNEVQVVNQRMNEQENEINRFIQGKFRLCLIVNIEFEKLIALMSTHYETDLKQLLKLQMMVRSFKKQLQSLNHESKWLRKQATSFGGAFDSIVRSNTIRNSKKQEVVPRNRPVTRHKVSERKVNFREDASGDVNSFVTFANEKHEGAFDSNENHSQIQNQLVFNEDKEMKF